MAKGILNIQANDGAVIGLHVPDGLGSGERQIALGVNLSGITAYHLLQGNLSVSNEVITNGFSTTLHTGNGSTQSINTGIDMDTQWGNDASEKFGGLVWIKSRSAATNNFLFDTIRGTTKEINSDTTEAEATLANSLTTFTSTGMTLGNAAGINVSAATYASWNFQTTHRTSGVTNHGKPYTCHYNPYTGFTIIKYEGSELAGHKIPHHLGRELGFVTVKNLSTASDWIVTQNNQLGNLKLNTTVALGNIATAYFISDENTVSTVDNTLTNQYIMYGWANSYLDESNKLIGNYEIGVYQGTGVAQKIKTKGKPAWVMFKRLDSTGDWIIFDNNRSITKPLYPNLSSTEGSSSGLAFETDGITTTSTAGGQYLYMVVYDNDNGSGKSKYPKATDSSQLQLNTALVPFANGIDSSGAKNTIVYKNETITGLTLTAGKNYVYAKNDGTYGVKAIAPQYLKQSSTDNTGYTARGHEFNINSNKWLNVVSTPYEKETTLGSTVDYFSDSSGKALYRFEDNVIDTSGSYNGTASNITYSTGKFGKAAVFNGTNSYVDTSLTTNFTPVTFSFWVKFNTLTDYQILLSKRSTNSTYGAGFNIYLAGGYLKIEEYNGVSGTDNNVSSVQLQTGQYYHVVVERNSIKNKIYVNGINNSTGTGKIFLESTSVLRLGQYITQGLRDYTAVPFNGQLDQLRIFNKSLSDNEIKDLYSVYQYTYEQEAVNYLDAIVHADANGQLAYVEELPKIEYKDIVKATKYEGKNACTSYGEFNGAVTPPRLNDGFNIASIIRINTGVYDVYFKEPMDNLNYSVNYNTAITSSYSNGGVSYTKYLHKVTVSRYENGWYDHSSASVQIFGGKNS